MKKIYGFLMILFTITCVSTLSFAGDTNILINEHGQLVNSNQQLVNAQGQRINGDGTLWVRVIPKPPKYIKTDHRTHNSQYSHYQYLSPTTVKIVYDDNCVFVIRQNDTYDGSRQLGPYPFTYTFEHDGDVDIFLKGRIKIEIDSPYDDANELADDVFKSIFVAPVKYKSVKHKPIIKKQTVIIINTKAVKKKPVKKKKSPKKKTTKKKK